MKCACVFENREDPDFSGSTPVVITECGYHACLRRDGDYIKHDADYAWHVALNEFNTGLIGTGEFRHWMYESKTMANELPRLIRLHRDERLGKMAKTHTQCSVSPTEKVEDNHLSCCLGVECRKCPELLSLEKAKLTPEQIDVAKAWTCVGHIASKGGDHMKEGYLLTVGDRMFWDHVYESLSQSEDDPTPTTGAAK